MTTRPRPTAAPSSSSAVGWEVSAVVVAHCDTLTSVTSAACERVAAAHRLNELFASCQSREAAGHPAATAGPPGSHAARSLRLRSRRVQEGVQSRSRVAGVQSRMRGAPKPQGVAR